MVGEEEEGWTDLAAKWSRADNREHESYHLQVRW